MDDEVVGGWSIDPQVREGLRLEHIRKALERNDFEAAAVEAEELLDEQPDHAEALFLLGECLLEVGDSRGATLAYGRYIEVSGEPPVDPGLRASALSGLAVARFEIADLTGSIEAARGALALQTDLPETHYYLGLALERSGRATDGAGALLAAHRLDPEAYPLPPAVAAFAWEGLVREALGKLPVSLQRFWAGVDIQVVDLPDLAELQAADPPISPLVPALFEGEPPGDADPWLNRPERLRVFARNIARFSQRSMMVEELTGALLDEALAWLDLDESDLPAE